METIKNLSSNIDSLATLIVALLFGWEIAQPEENTQDYSLDTEVLDLLVRNSGIGEARANNLLDYFGPEKLLRLLAEGDTVELETCPGIGDKLSTKMVRGLTYLAQDMCRTMELNQELADRPCFEVISEDREQERFFQVWEKDSWGKPGWVSYPTWVNNNNRYSCSSDGVTDTTKLFQDQNDVDAPADRKSVV